MTSAAAHPFSTIPFIGYRKAQLDTLFPFCANLPTSDHASSPTQRFVMVLPRMADDNNAAKMAERQNAAKMAGPLCRRDSFKWCMVQSVALGQEV